jgi:heme-based aerotactic transducer
MSNNQGSTESINLNEFKARLDYMGFTAEDARRLEKLKPWAESVSKKFAKKFYDPQFENAEFRAIVEGNGSTRAGLEGAQAGYMISWFGGYPDESYIKYRQLIGGLHAKIGVTPQWYISSYRLYETIFFPMLVKHLRLSRLSSKKVLGSISSLMAFDQAIIMDKYIQGLTDRIQGVVDKVTIAAKSVAESSGEMSHTAEQAGSATQHIASASQEIASGATNQAENVQIHRRDQQDHTGRARAGNRCRRRQQDRRKRIGTGQ